MSGVARVRRRAATTFVCAALLATSTACVSLPSHSPVRPGTNPGGGGLAHNLTYVPIGPVPHADRVSIVHGYLDAMLASPPDPSIVREFMTPSAAGSWNPDQELQVYESSSVGPATASGVSVHASLLGSIDTRGSWTSTDAHDDTLDVPLTLTKIGDEWRVANPIPGILVDTDYLRHLHQYSMYFFDATHRLLSPDPVYLLVGHPSSTANALVTDLLEGPTASMDGVVHPEVPHGTALAHPVTVAPGGLADISLTAQAESMSQTALKLFAAELVWTLRQERLGISHIRLSILGRPVHLAALPVDFSVDALRAYGSPLYSSRDLYGLVDGKLRTISVSQNSSSKAGRLSNAPLARSVAIRIDGRRGAVVTQDGHDVWVGPLGPVDAELPNELWFHGGSDLLPPSWDVDDVLWLVDRTADGAVVRVMTGPGPGTTVFAPGISGQDVRSFAISRDGTRFAALVGTGSASHLVIAMIARSESNRTSIDVRGTRVIANAQFPLVSMTQLSWFGPTSVVVLAQDQSSEVQPFQVSIDGSKVLRSPGFLPVLPSSIAAVGDPGDPSVPLVIGTKDGQLYSRDAQQNWSPFLSQSKLFAPTYPG